MNCSENLVKQVTWNPGNRKKVKFVEIIMMKKSCIIRGETAYNNYKKGPAISWTKKKSLSKSCWKIYSQKNFFACYKHFLDKFLNTNEYRVTLMRKAYPSPTLQNMEIVNSMSFVHYIWKPPRSWCLQQDVYLMSRKKTQWRVWAKFPRLR